MTMTAMRLGKETGSIMNWIKSGNNTPPVDGAGATHLMWSDREAYTVISVSADGTQVTMRRDRATRTDKSGMSDSQSYLYEPDEKGKIVKLTKRHGSWRQIVEEIVFTGVFSAILAEMDSETKAQEVKEIFNESGDFVLVKGKTRVRKTYPKFNVIFGIRDEYYDYSF